MDVKKPESKFKKSEFDIKLQRIRKERTENYALARNHVINLTEFESDSPCPICGTILNEIKNTTVKDHFNKRKKSGELNPWVCTYCCYRLTNPPKEIEKIDEKNKRPRGWFFMREYVDLSGNVFHFGVEKPELKGTIQSTPLPDISLESKKIKETKQEKLAKFLSASSVIEDLKKVLKSDHNLSKKEIAEIYKKISQQEKIVKKYKA